MPNTVGFPAIFQRLNPYPLDISQKFDNLSAFETYLTSGVAYPGQIVGVENATNVPDAYIVNKDLTYTKIATGTAASPVSEYAQNTEYREGYLVFYGNKLFVVTQTFTSDNTGADADASLDIDLTANKLTPVSGTGGGTATVMEMGNSFVATNPLFPNLNGQTISNTDMVYDVLKQILRPTVAPTYQSPTLSLAGSAPSAGLVEYGTDISPTLTPTFTQRDGGVLSEYRLLRNGSPIHTGTSASAMSDLPAFAIDAVTTYTAEADYGIGPVKNDSEGNPDPAGQITPGTAHSGSVTYTPCYRIFAGSLTANTPLTTSAQIRALPITELNPQNGTSIPVSVSTGANQRQIVFAYPATLRSPTSIIMQSMGFDMKGSFTESVVAVDDASGGNPINYKILSLVVAIPFVDDTYTLTI